MPRNIFWKVGFNKFHDARGASAGNQATLFIRTGLKEPETICKAKDFYDQQFVDDLGQSEAIQRDFQPRF
ncbi:hypothetical protein [Parasphingopyxis sp.]|uniref:hypothetical protein n=1 Tax=Parasphingopyxis sp. TaxID=1920299 RepID=UPI003FA092ED